MRCNLCGNDGFTDFNGRKGVRCSACGSLERTRLLWLFLDRLALSSRSRVLHLAPERPIYRKLSSIVSRENYHLRDIQPANYPFAHDVQHLDLCDLASLASNSYDLILHSHVLEHTGCNIAYTLFHLHRALKPDGSHVFLVPFMSGKYDECFQDIGPAERIRRFGQDDHVRRFGLDDVAMHLGKLVELDPAFDAELEFGAAMLEGANIPRAAWKGLSPHLPIKLGKTQMTLMQAAP